MSYESWRISFQSSEQAARAAYAEIEALRAEVSGLRAARIAYANEFPATEDGDPDTGNIHANIRALKARAEQLAAEVEELRAEVAETREFRGKMANAIGNDQLRRFIEKHGEPVPLTIRMQAAEARAERLAEALRVARARAADLAAWLKSGNDVPADLPFVFRERWQKIANDIRALEAALAQEDCA